MTLLPIGVTDQPPVKRKAPNAEPEMRWLDVADLVVNDLYQRPIGAKGWGVIREIPEFAKWSDYALAVMSFKALLNKAARDGEIGNRA